MPDVVNRKQFPALTDEDWEDMEKSSESREYRTKRNDAEIRKITKRMEGLTLDSNVGLNGDSSGDIRVVLIGKTGSGKSATANTIFGEDKFKTSRASQSQTQVSKRVTGKVNGRIVSVVDTPGLADTGKEDKYIKKEIARFAEFLPDGVHAFLYVMNMADPRFTKEDQSVFEHIKDMFGNGFERYCLLVFTRGEAGLEEYYREEIRMKTPLGDFLGKLIWRVTAIVNNAPTVFERQLHRDSLLNKIGTKNTPPPVYSNKAFERAQDLFEKYRKKAQKENWDQSVLHFVEEIVGLDPEISRIDLEREVQERIAQQHQEEMKLAADNEEKLRKKYEKKEKERKEELEAEINRKEGELKAREQILEEERIQREKEFEREGTLRREHHEKELRERHEEEDRKRQSQLQEFEEEKRKLEVDYKRREEIATQKDDERREEEVKLENRRKEERRREEQRRLKEEEEWDRRRKEQKRREEEELKQRWEKIELREQEARKRLQEEEKRHEEEILRKLERENELRRQAQSDIEEAKERLEKEQRDRAAMREEEQRRRDEVERRRVEMEQEKARLQSQANEIAG